jgi:predicted MPP superfamily phosphohydrolase
MRITSFLIFIGIVFLIYFSINYYIFIRGLQVFSISPLWRKTYITLFLVSALSFIAGEFLEHTHPSAIGEWIYRIGAFWLAFMLYLFLIVLFVDIVRLINYFFHFIPELSLSFKFITGLVVLGFVSVSVLLGHLNAINPKIREISLSIPKHVLGENKMKLLMVSDIHLGGLVGENREEKLVRLIKNQQPDLVVLCGDIVDGDIGEVLRKNLGRHIQEIKASLGVFAIPGNHEYIGGITKTLPYLESINIRVLRDLIVRLTNGIQLVGRDDIDNERMAYISRKKLSQLLEGCDKNYPVIVLNHQPRNLDEAVKEGVDLHLSGHTHNGQLWPLNYMTKAIYELSWGFLKKGDTNFYVSSGFGTWGPHVRTGNTPEIVVFNLIFAK